MAFRLSMISIACFVLSACSSAPPSTSVRGEIAPTNEFVILPGDTLSVKFFYNSELNEEVTVRPDGRISLQLIDEITAAGKTPSQLTAILSEKYEKELRTPQVTVIVRSFSGHKIYVDGEVNKPGDFVVASPLTLLQAIAGAGGLKETAGNNQVIIIRRTLDPKPLIITADVEAAAAGRDLTQDIPIYPLDIVYVPRSQISNVNQWVDLYIRKNIPFYPSIGLFYPIQ